MHKFGEKLFYYHWNRNSKVPLLLSKSSLKKADTVLNTRDDKIKMFGQNVPVEFSFNGHYSIETTSNFDDTQQVLIFEENETIEGKQES